MQKLRIGRCMNVAAQPGAPGDFVTMPIGSGSGLHATATTSTIVIDRNMLDFDLKLVRRPDVLSPEVDPSAQLPLFNRSDPPQFRVSARKHVA